MQHGFLRCVAQLVVLLSMSGMSASCMLPMSLHYYEPSADGAVVRSISCSGDPPYMASMFGGMSPKFHLMVSLAKPSLWSNESPVLAVIINPGFSSEIAVDPTLIRITADGLAIVPKSIRYAAGKSPGPTMDASGPIDINSNYLVIHIPLGTPGVIDVVTHLPPVAVAGELKQFPDITFKLEKHTRLIMIAGNC